MKASTLIVAVSKKDEDSSFPVADLFKALPDLMQEFIR